MNQEIRIKELNEKWGRNYEKYQRGLVEERELQVNPLGYDIKQIEETPKPLSDNFDLKPQEKKKK